MKNVTSSAADISILNSRVYTRLVIRSAEHNTHTLVGHIDLDVMDYPRPVSENKWVVRHTSCKHNYI